jgi:hypothetical protein
MRTRGAGEIRAITARIGRPMPVFPTRKTVQTHTSHQLWSRVGHERRTCRVPGRTRPQTFRRSQLAGHASTHAVRGLYHPSPMSPAMCNCQLACSRRGREAWLRSDPAGFARS